MTTKDVEIVSLESRDEGYVAWAEEMGDQGTPVARVAFAVKPEFANNVQDQVDRGERVPGKIDDGNFLSREEYGAGS